MLRVESPSWVCRGMEKDGALIRATARARRMLPAECETVHGGRSKLDGSRWTAHDSGVVMDVENAPSGGGASAAPAANDDRAGGGRSVRS